MNLSPCGEIVRRGDPVRFRCALFAPPGPREHLFALYAFNLEIARIAPLVSEPMLGEIRLQWWREVIAQIYGGEPVRRHEVATPLAAAVQAGDLPRGPFDALIDARGNDLDPAFPSGDVLLTKYVEDTAGGLTVLAALALAPDAGADGQAATHDAGFAIGAARYLMAVPQLAAMGRKPPPMSVVDNLAEEARARLARARQVRAAVPKSVAPALLEARAADHALTAKTLRSPFRERLSLLWRGSTGRW